MARYKKIPDEWVGDWGLTWTEGAILADMLVWDCTIKERAERCYVSIRTVNSAIAKFRTIEGAKIALSKCAKSAHPSVQNLHTNGAKSAPFSKEKKEKKEIPPTPPINKKNNKKKNQQEQLLFPSDAFAPTPQKEEKKEEVKVYSLQYRCQKFFEEAYRQYKGVAYRFEPKDAAALKRLINSLKFTLRSENRSDADDETEIFFQEFINTLIIVKPDKWIDEKFSLSNINSQFNEIYSQLKNGTASTKPTNRHQPRFSAEFLADIANGLAGGN